MSLSLNISMRLYYLHIPYYKAKYRIHNVQNSKNSKRETTILKSPYKQHSEYLS